MWIQTFDDRAFWLADPKAEDIRATTISVVLARKCRFGGHCKRFYSVAQHSLIVSQIVPPALSLVGLLHDAHEVYSGFGDVLRPAKYLNEDVSHFLTRHTERIDAAIAERFRFDPGWFQSKDIKHADAVALATEARDVMGHPPIPWEQLPDPLPTKIQPWTVEESYIRYTERLSELCSAVL